MELYFRPLLQLATAFADTAAFRPHAQQLRQALDAIIADAASACAAAGIPEPDYRDALYALVALLDELFQSHYPPEEWRPATLALQHFEDNTTGIGFFTRLEAIKNEQRLSVLRVYYIALGLGFTGKYGPSADQVGLATHRRTLANQLGLSSTIQPLAAAASPGLPTKPAWYAWSPLALIGVSLCALLVVLAVR